MAETRDNNGALFKNDKQGVETRPDYTGPAMVEGVEYYVSAWLKQGAKGTFMSLSFKRKGESAPKQAAAKAAGNRPDLDDSIPFAPEFR